MKHVLFIAGWCDPFGDFIKEHAYAISTLHQVSYIYVEFIKSNNHLPFKIEIKQEHRHSTQLYFVKIYSPVRRFGLFNLLCRSAYRKLIKEVSAQHPVHVCHVNVRTPITEVITTLRELSSIPIVLTEHSSFYHYGLQQTYSGDALLQEKMRVTRWLNQSAIKMIMPVSAQLSAVLNSSWGVPNERLTVVPNVAAPEFAYKEKTEHVLLQVAMLAIWKAPKNPMLMARALALLTSEERKKIAVNWMGEGPLLDEVKRFLQQHAPEVNVNYPGIVYDRKQVAAALQAADVFVHPSDAENLPCVLIESLCCGTPVVSYELNGIPEMVDTSNGILLPPGNFTDLAGALRQLIKNKNTFNSQAIAMKAGRRYSHAAIAAAYDAVYTQVTQ